jgi:hypothetical protein
MIAPMSTAASASLRSIGSLASGSPAWLRALSLRQALSPNTLSYREITTLSKSM